MPVERDIDIRGITRIGEQMSTIKNSEVVKELQRLLDDYSRERFQLEWNWRSYYTNYLTTPEAKRSNLTHVSRNLGGDVDVNWRHNIKSPKAYEIVETLTSYFMGAFFPNERWFDLIPQEPMGIEFGTLIELNRQFMNNKLEQAMFKSNCRVFIRETCIAGTSALMFPWVDNNIRFRVLSPFEFLLDPRAQMANDANMIRSYELSLPEFKQYIREDVFNLTTLKESEDMMSPTVSPSHDFRIDKDTFNSVSRLMGLSDIPRTNQRGRFVRIYEFWGDIILEDVVLRDVRASWTDQGILLALDANPYVGKPFIIGTYSRLSQSPYGIGALQPVSSQIFYKDQLTSRNADNVAVASDTMLEVVQDGILDPDDVFIAPGKKFFVTERDSVRPINMQYAGGVTVQEMGLLDQTMDKAIGTGPFIGVGNQRQAERVTAAEVQAQRDVGGSRLSDVFSELESTFLLPFLQRFHIYCRQFYQGGDSVRLGVVHVPIDPRIIDFPFTVKALGAANVADKEYNLRQLLDWLAIVGQNQMLAALVNWGEVLRELTYMMNPMIAERLVMSAQQMQGPSTPAGELQESAEFLGGGAAQGALQAAQQAGTMPQLTEQLATGLGLGGQL